MHILSEPNVSKIFRSLTQAQCHGFISALGNALISITQESKPSTPASAKKNPPTPPHSPQHKR
ncbi:hypothetical protein N7530_004436 [Penicillium desertorum]|uniref:Uncharacterized protein n=1 Tax=Penicillium desertorum TaxID=1303715 RepID=A0A9X0BQR8_9EURO|nr:hypothetical protein N7530_004436 [Penicillium desertorum]